MAQQTIGLGAAANDNTGDDLRTGGQKINDNFTELYGRTAENIVIVKDPSDFLNVDSSKEYFLDCMIDMGSTSIEVPVGGITIRGSSFNVSGLYSSQASYTMFTSPVGGCGDILATDIQLSVTGTGSKIYGVTAKGTGADIGLSNIRYLNCVSLGTLTAFRQGLETNVLRFGGTPSLELDGIWTSGYRSDVALTAAIDNAMTAPIFKAGATFSMTSRFITNMNADLGTTAPFIDFSQSNFPNPSTLQLSGCKITRNGVADPTDTTVFPNIDNTALASNWKDNRGLPNTFSGGEVEVSTEAATTITVQNQFEDLAGTFVNNDFQHFDSPAAGQLRHLGDTPREYRLVYDLRLAGTANDVVDTKIVIWRDSGSTFEDGKVQTRVINNLAGGNDLAFVQLTTNIVLDTNDYVKLQVANASNTGNITAKIGSYILIDER